MEFKVGRYRISFDLGPGVYTAWPESSAGKTYTCRLLQGCVTEGNKDILLLTHESVKYLSEEAICDLIKRHPYKLIFADRADLYLTRKIMDVLLLTSAVVYVDCKNNNVDDALWGSDCDIEFSETEIRYYVDPI